jgi:MYXO-CTERM domain-containing protein
MIARQNGETIRGEGVSGASRIEALPEAGQPELIDEPDNLEEQPGVLLPELVRNPDMHAFPFPGMGEGFAEAGNDDEGCNASGASHFTALWLLALLGLPRRRRI